MNNDFAEFQGKTYISFPPFPAVLMMPLVALAGSPEDFMDRQADEDAENTKLGAAAKHVKAAHLLIKEADLRLRSSRTATAPQSAIRHDLQRLVELIDEVKTEGGLALEALAR